MKSLIFFTFFLSTFSFANDHLITLNSIDHSYDSLTTNIVEQQKHNKNKDGIEYQLLIEAYDISTDVQNHLNKMILLLSLSKEMKCKEDKKIVSKEILSRCNNFVTVWIRLNYDYSASYYISHKNNENIGPIFDFLKLSLKKIDGEYLKIYNSYK